MYINAIKTVVTIKSPTGRVNSPVSSPVRGRPQPNPLPVSSPVRGRPQHNPLPVSNKDNLNQVRATGQWNNHIKTGARDLKIITSHNSTEAPVRADQAVPVDPVAEVGVVVVEAAAEGDSVLK